MADLQTFAAGDQVHINADVKNAQGKHIPHCGKLGEVLAVLRGGALQIDVPGMAVVTVKPTDVMKIPGYGSGGVKVEPAAAPTAAAVAQGAGQPVTDVVPKGEEPLAPVPAAPAAPGMAYGQEVLAADSIVESLTNPRKYFDPEALQELADSIKELGLAQPILVRPLPAARREACSYEPMDPKAAYPFPPRKKLANPPTHELVAGARRFRACRMAGVRTLPVLIRNLTDAQVLRLQIVENLQRKDLHDMEEAQGYRSILDLPDQADRPMAKRVEDLAGSIKKSTRYIYQRLQLLKLCEFARTAFIKGHIEHFTLALEIAKIGNESQQIEATREIAGLDAKGKPNGTAGMTQRRAAEYVRDNFTLVLSKAPFPVKVVYAEIGACTTCPKMSANARHLFDEGDPGPDTCLDRSCYGRKNAAHTLQLAEAAKARGQRVITGAQAKKVLPYDSNNAAGGYTSLDERCYEAEGKNYGKTVRQILGNDVPLPVLVQNPHKAGFVEVLPDADVKNLLKAKGIGAKSSNKPDANRAKVLATMKLEKAWRNTAAAEILAGVSNMDDGDLLDGLLKPLAIATFCRLDHENSKRVRALLGWTLERAWNANAKIVKHFDALQPEELNKFFVASLIAHCLGVHEHGSADTGELEAIGKLCGVDAKAVKARLQAEERKKAQGKAAMAKAVQAIKDKRAKPAPAKKAAAGKKSTRPSHVAFMKELHCSPQLQAVVGSAPIPRTEVVSKLWAYIKKHKLQDANNKRMVNTDDKLRAIFGKKTVSMFEMAGLVGSQCSDRPKKEWSAAGAPAAAPKKTAKAKPAEKQLDLALPDKLKPQSAWPFPTAIQPDGKGAAA